MLSATDIQKMLPEHHLTENEAAEVRDFMYMLAEIEVQVLNLPNGTDNQIPQSIN
jgi:hypothetical protein